MSDDIIVSGRTRRDHDERLRAVLQRLNDAGLTLNSRKSVFNVQQLDFFGLNFSDKGISVHVDKVSALKQAKPPKNPSELRSLLGLANYCSLFIRDLAKIVQPLRELTKTKTKWEWNENHSNALDELKSKLTTDAMAYFDRRLRTEITVDASPVGLGAAMAQFDPQSPENKQVVQYISRALTDVERRYSQAEKEALAVVWTCD